MHLNGNFIYINSFFLFCPWHITLVSRAASWTSPASMLYNIHKSGSSLWSRILVCLWRQDKHKWEFLDMVCVHAWVCVCVCKPFQRWGNPPPWSDIFLIKPVPFKHTKRVRVERRKKSEDGVLTSLINEHEHKKTAEKEEWGFFFFFCSFWTEGLIHTHHFLRFVGNVLCYIYSYTYCMP